MAIVIPKVPAYIDDPKVMRAWFQSIRVEAEAGSDLVQDTTPQLGGQLDVNGQAIGDGTNELLTFVEDASAVNHIEIENEAAGGGPYIRSAGDDANPNLNLVAKGAGNVRILDGADETKNISFTLSASTTGKSVDIVSNHTDNRTITLPDATGTLLSTGAGVTVAQLADGTDGELITWDSSGNATTIAAGTSGQILTSNGAGAEPTFQTNAGGISDIVEDTTPQLGGDLDTNDKDILIDSGRGLRDESDNEQITFNTTASAVNYLDVTNAATGNDPVFKSNGSDAAVGLTIDTKGTGTLQLGTADSVINIAGSVTNIDEGVVVGSPTGGDKGTGTVNATAVYDDNTLLTCYVFDQAVDGHIDNSKWDQKSGNKRTHKPMRKFKERIGTEYDPLDTDKYVQHFKDKKHLTSMPNEDKFNVEEGMATGTWIQRLIETVEIQAVHIGKLNDRLKELERNET